MGPGYLYQYLKSQADPKRFDYARWPSDRSQNGEPGRGLAVRPVRSDGRRCDPIDDGIDYTRAYEGYVREAAVERA